MASPTQAPYISPSPSANPSLRASPTPTQAPGEINDCNPAKMCPKNAKEYWKQAHASLKQSDQPNGKRKRHSDVENGGQVKRHQGAHADEVSQAPQTSALPPNDNEFSGDGSTAPGVGQGASSTQSGDLGPTEKDRQVQQFLGVDANLDDPQSRRDLYQLYNAVTSFGQDKCKLVDQKWQLDNFRTSLYPHQVIGVSWMLSRELHPAAPTGGILADEMGLGKTVQLLACMSQNLPGKHSKATKTLIIAPKRLLTQWFNEIKSHCSHKKMKRVFIYEASKIMTDAQWEDESIILTNYSQLQRQLPPFSKLGQIEKFKQKGNPKWKTLLRKHSRGGLFKIDWHRVVLDEAHAINNRTSQTSKACRLLLRKYSWVLSGTPMTNDTDELFPYLDFIRSTYSDFGKYHGAMGDISNIPENRPAELITVDFSPFEGRLYHLTSDKLQELRERARNHKAGDGSEAIPKGELHRHFDYLRYFTSHPALVEPNYFDQQTRQPQCGHAFCKACVKKSQKGSRKDRHCLSCGKTPSTVSEGGKEYYRHTGGYFEKLKGKFAGSDFSSKGKRIKRMRKPGDDEFGIQPRLTQRKKARRGRRKAKKSKGRRAKAKKDDAERRIRTNAGGFLRACDTKPWDPIPHSAKTRATMDLVNKWQKEAPDDKIIIFIQWIPMLSFLGRMIFQNGIKFVYLWGEMESTEQEMAIKAFQLVREIKIMLISVSCGAHGLNLTAANRAIVFDHWWHEGLERQAFARVHRIGQTKEVHTAKLVAAGSMDEAILGMQARKRETIGSAVGDGTAHPKYAEDGHIDKEILELARLNDISDGESEVGGVCDNDGDSGSDSSTDGSSDDEDEDEDDGDYDTDATTGSLYESEAGKSWDEDSDAHMNMDSDDE
ncbi:SNF2 family N-terminal domain-containing protein [Chaetomium fimeti]|uniref:SNF2 family N-terminal domain-containing protein n=1 Tax=Chaetomium fimeti TaxID=1854472 RepID=A0AAE0HIP9_9PEZI|nr:SNF2 family N-terminal domain-containing protein [Chaetomium fimeti]